MVNLFARKNFSPFCYCAADECVHPASPALKHRYFFIA
jgi:hypothetical protein